MQPIFPFQFPFQYDPPLHLSPQVNPTFESKLYRLKVPLVQMKSINGDSMPSASDVAANSGELPASVEEDRKVWIIKFNTNSLRFEQRRSAAALHPEGSRTVLSISPNSIFCTGPVS